MLFNETKEIVKTDTQINTPVQDFIHDIFSDDDEDIFGYGKLAKKATSQPAETLTNADLDPFFEPGNKARSYELQYARDLNRDPGLKVSEKGGNTFLYQWGGSCWNRLSETQGKRMAWVWLKQFAPKNAKESTANSLYGSSLLELGKLPETPRESIVPLMDVWLIVGNDGRFQVKQPNMAWGVTYQVNAALQIVGDKAYYEPQPLPADSHFGRFLALSLPNREEQMLVQEYCGYTLLNDVRFQKAQVWVGDGCNGKSVLLKIIEQLHSKVGSIRLDQLSGFGLAPLVDSSLIICAEAPKRGIDEQELKKIISGDALSIEYKFMDMFMYSPVAKMLVACNRFPHITDDSNGVWRRLQIIRWEVNISKGQEVPNLDRLIIENELKFVVDWCLEGLSRLLKRGDFDEPKSVLLRKENEKINSNNALAFVDDYGIQISKSGATIEKEKLYAKYDEFCTANGLTAFHGAEFWKRMKQRFPDMQENKRTVGNRRLRVVNLVLGANSVSASGNDDDLNPFNEK